MKLDILGGTTDMDEGSEALMEEEIRDVIKKYAVRGCGKTVTRMEKEIDEIARILYKYGYESGYEEGYNEAY